jgi:hypothetical protein
MDKVSIPLVSGEMLSEKTSVEKLLDRCKQAGLSVHEQDDFFDEGKDYIVELPAGREKRRLYLHSEEQIQKLLSTPFENYVVLRPFEAICSYTDGTIEALLRTLERIPIKGLRRRMLGRGFWEDDEEDDINFTLYNEDRSIEVSLSPPTETLIALLPRAKNATISLKISGISVDQHDNAVRLLQRISDSLFFQIDTSMGVALNLSRDISSGNRSARQAPGGALDDLQFPTQEYDEAPMSLYWYGRGAHGMPLLQFLAYYQVIEYYYPTYFQAEARRKIRRVLKDPTFRADRDADIGRVLTSLTGGRGGVGDERSMLRATIQECIDPGELRHFISRSEERTVFLSSKAKGLSSTKIPVANPDADLRNDVADRLYEIRCKIVHTKGDSRDGEVELLLPFSPEASQLNHDVDLAQYLARQVLINASAHLRAK